MEKFYESKIKKLSGFLISAILFFSLGAISADIFRPEEQKVSGIENKSDVTVDVDFSPFWKAWNVIGEKHISADKTSNQARVWGAIQGLTSSLGDPYSVFFPPKEAEVFEEDIRGNFEGVGMEIGKKEDVLTIITPIKGSPAERAGLKAGDKILQIDERVTSGVSVDEAVKLIRGQRGTMVKLAIYRGGVEKPFEVKVVRDVIQIPTIETKKIGDVFVLSLYNFSSVSPNLFRNALREFVLSGGDKLILDLRNNPGGFLEAAVDMASWFLESGKTIVTEDFKLKEENIVYRSKGYSIFNENLKMVVLVNEGSASASEILAGALKEHGVAKLVGAKTFGKGSVQEVIKITPDTSLKLTVAKWLTPNGNSISDSGIVPDVEIKLTEANVKGGKDPQMTKALEVVGSL